MVLAKVLSLAVAIAAAAGSAPNQVDPGTNVPGKATASPVTHTGGKPDKAALEISRARELTSKFAACVVASKNRRAQAAAVVLDDVPNSAIMKKYSGLIDPGCLPYGDAIGMKLSMPGDFFRYAMAEALIAAEVPPTISDFRPVPPLTQRTQDASKYIPQPGKKYSQKQLQELDHERLTDLAEIFVSRYGECVVRLDPLNSRKLLSTKPSSPEEGTVFGLLYPTLASCLEPGRTVTINRGMVRGTVAVNYYRLVTAMRTTTLQGISK
jgi:hypothetical protein